MPEVPETADWQCSSTYRPTSPSSDTSTEHGNTDVRVSGPSSFILSLRERAAICLLLLLEIFQPGPIQPRRHQQLRKGARKPKPDMLHQIVWPQAQPRSNMIRMQRSHGWRKRGLIFDLRYAQSLREPTYWQQDKLPAQNGSSEFSSTKISDKGGATGDPVASV